ncbi:MAG: hypothetical protein CMI18_02300 [Opitutaceae bacterium]|nr:hypothetical protein [Opitutaceae bacterium]|tara:strand:+ start:384 stop:1847 length:1464 start_codon:yes stop_codon:yes gene_type:complete
MRIASLAVLLFAGLGLSSLLAKQKLNPINMEGIRDASTLEVEVIEDWHFVSGKVPTRQKFMTIRVGEFWPGKEYRVPVRLIVPADKKAKGIHLTGDHAFNRIQTERPLRPIETLLVEGGVGLVYTVVQNLNQSGQGVLSKEIEARFLKTLDPRSSVQTWGWPASLSRAVTAAYSESGYFEQGKVALSGGSKNGASPSMALIHDNRLTAVHATVSPIWASPLRLSAEGAWEKMKQADLAYVEAHGLDAAEKDKIFNHAFRGGYFGPEYVSFAMAQGRTWKDLKDFAKSLADSVFISRNKDALNARGVDLYFAPGTHDFVCYDIQWGGKHHPDIPVYFKTNSGHGKNKGHPARETDESNLQAFLLQHFFIVEGELLSPPEVSHNRLGDALEVKVQFASENPAESGRIWWMFNRGIDGSASYLNVPFPDDQWLEMKFDMKNGMWTATIPLNDGAKTIDFFSNHRKTIRYRGEDYYSYLSSPYSRIRLIRR